MLLLCKVVGGLAPPGHAQEDVIYYSLSDQWILKEVVRDHVKFISGRES